MCSFFQGDFSWFFHQRCEAEAAPPPLPRRPRTPSNPPSRSVRSDRYDANRSPVWGQGPEEPGREGRRGRQEGSKSCEKISLKLGGSKLLKKNGMCWKTIYSSWWFLVEVSTPLKNMIVSQNGNDSTNFGVKIKKYLSCHLPEDVFHFGGRL